MEDYDEALLQAHKNYENDDKSNPFHIKAYFDCLIRNVKSRGNSEEILQELLENLSKINTDKAREMTLLAKADYQSIFIADNDAALKLVDEAIAMYKFSIYPIKSKFAILEHDLDIIGMEKLISDYEKILKEEKHVNDPYINNSIKIMKAKVFAYKAEYDLALSIIDNQLKFYPEKSKEFLRAKIIQIKDRKTR